VLFGLCVASSVRVMPAYKFGPSGFVRRSLVFCDFTYLCNLSEPVSILTCSRRNLSFCCAASLALTLQ
jgi:hypothetical protein